MNIGLKMLEEILQALEHGDEEERKRVAKHLRYIYNWPGKEPYIPAGY